MQLVVKALGLALLVTHVLSQEQAEAPPPRPTACEIAQVTWAPQFGAKQSLQAGRQLPGATSVSQDDSVDLTVELNCKVTSPAYGSAIFTGDDDSAVTCLLKAKGSGQMKGTIKMADVAAQGSSFTVAVHIGDADMLPLSNTLGSVIILSRDGTQPVPSPPPSKYAAQFAIPPEIRHLHRGEHQQPPAAVPLSAVAVLLAELAAWLVLLPKFASRTAAPGSGTIAASAFLALLAAALAFAVWFWLRLTLLDALIPAAALALGMVIVGHAALSGLAGARIAQEGKARKSE